MSKDGFILHEWQKDKFDALVKYNEIEDAKKEGIEKGKAEGTKEKTIEIAKNMLKENIDLDTIFRVTGLTKKDIQTLRNTEN